MRIPSGNASTPRRRPDRARARAADGHPFRLPQRGHRTGAPATGSATIIRISGRSLKRATRRKKKRRAALEAEACARDRARPQRSAPCPPAAGKPAADGGGALTGVLTSPHLERSIDRGHYLRGAGLSKDQEIGQGIAGPAAGALILRIPAPLGAAATAVRTWFNEIIEAEAPVLNGSLAADREAAEACTGMVKGESMPRTCRATVRAWCK